MNPFAKLRSALGALVRRRQLDAEMDAELRCHIELQTRENLEAGMSPEEARFAALRQFGRADSIKEAARDQRGGVWLEHLAQDLRQGTRLLGKSPGFTTVAVLTLALGIGANTAIFSVINAVLLRPLPYPAANRLVALSERGADGESSPIAFPNFTDWRAQQGVFGHIGVYKTESAALTGSGEPAQLQGARVSADLLAALDARPLLGRLFLPAEDTPSAAPVVLISHAFWQMRLAGSPAALNQSINLDDRPHTIVGVMPEWFAFPSRLDYWVPIGAMAADPAWRNRANRPGLRGLARLKDGVTLEQARAELDVIATRLEQQYPESNKTWRVQIDPLHESEVGGVRRALWTLLGAVGLVLLIACANLANLFLARAAGRRQEMALRSALGASRGRVVRQLLTESMLFALIGGGAGVLLAAGSLRLLTSLIAGGVPRASEITLDGPVLLFSALVALGAGVLFGLAPAWQAARADLQTMLKEASRGTTGRGARLRHGLVVAEVALTLLLLVGAGLMLRSFHRLQTLDPGFETARVLTFQINLPPRKYNGPDRLLAFHQTLLEKLRALPGVESASLSLRTPLEGGGRTTGYQVEGEPVPAPHARPSMNVQLAAPDYFRVVGTPLLRGRPFTERDNREHWRGAGTREDWASALNVIIIDEDFARRHWPNTDPIGRRIRPAFREDAPWLTVVGVVPKVKWRRLDESAGLVQAYLPLLQSPPAGIKVLIKTAASPESVVAEARQAVWSIDPDQPVHNVQTLAGLHERNTGPQRLNVTLLGVFALIALTLAVVGLYGVLAHAVARQRREIGVRMALGAQPRDILGLVVGQGMKLVLLGSVLGLAGALAGTRVLRGLLYQVAPTDPVTFMAIPLLLLAVSALACWLPARAAARVDPMEALRHE